MKNNLANEIKRLHGFFELSDDDGKISAFLSAIEVAVVTLEKFNNATYVIKGETICDQSAVNKLSQDASDTLNKMAKIMGVGE